MGVQGMDARQQMHRPQVQSPKEHRRSTATGHSWNMSPRARSELVLMSSPFRVCDKVPQPQSLAPRAPGGAGAGCVHMSRDAWIVGRADGRMRCGPVHCRPAAGARLQPTQSHALLSAPPQSCSGRQCLR